MVDRCVRLSLFRGERVWSRFLFLVDVQIEVQKQFLFEEGLSLSPLGETEEGFVTRLEQKNGVWKEMRDLTLIQVIDRRDGLPLSQGRGYSVGFFSG